MAGLAILALPLVMRLASHLTGSADIASATPAQSLHFGYIEASPSAGCALEKPVALQTTLNVTLADRRYLVYIPTNYRPDEPAPLILSYHGGTRVAEMQQALDQLSTPFFNEDYIVVYPNGIASTWQGTPNVTTNDLAFTTSILDAIEAEYCIDTNRIFATGKSQGGGLVNLLACDPVLSTRIAAFAPVAGAFYQSGFGPVCDGNTVNIPCSPGRSNIPVLNFHGLIDDTIAYAGGFRRAGCLPSIPHFCQRWADQNELPEANRTSRVPGTPFNSSAVRYEWGLGREKGLVTHIMTGTIHLQTSGDEESQTIPDKIQEEQSRKQKFGITDGTQDIGHDWPSTQPNSDNLTPGRHPATFNASSIILEFFEDHPLRLEDLRVLWWDRRSEM